MVAEALSSELPRDLIKLASAAVASAAETTAPRARRELDSGLRRAHAELELLYAIEQQIAAAEDVPTLIARALPRIQALLGFEAVALLWRGGEQCELFSLRGGQLPARRALDRARAQRAIIAVPLPLRAGVESGASEADLLCDADGLRLRDIYAAPLSDGNGPIGMLQLVNALERAHDESEMVRRVGLCAQQLGRGIALLVEREAAEHAERLALFGNTVNAIMRDLSAPLTAAASYVDVIAHEDLPEQRRKYAERAARALSHAERMVHELSAFARGQREVQARSLPVGPFVEELRELASAELQRFGASLRVALEYEGSARFDSGKLLRVFSTLCRDACEAGYTQFALNVKRVGEYLMFECVGSGSVPVQIAPAKPNDSLAPHGMPAGLGLGLAMAKKIVDAHCGRLHVNTDREHGAFFRIEIPI